MSMRAAGAYLRAMREKLGISQAELARRIQVSSSQVHRIEEGPGETRATLVAAAALAVGAEPEDVIRLLADSSATEKDGIALASSRTPKQADAASLAQRALHPEIVALAAKMTEFQLGKWVAIGERIVDE